MTAKERVLAKWPKARCREVFSGFYDIPDVPYAPVRDTKDAAWEAAAKLLEPDVTANELAELAEKAKCEFGWNAISKWWWCSKTSSQLGSGLTAEQLRDKLRELAKPKLPETMTVELPTEYVLAMADEPIGLLKENVLDARNKACRDALAKLRKELGIDE